MLNFPRKILFLALIAAFILSGCQPIEVPETDLPGILDTPEPAATATVPPAENTQPVPTPTTRPSEPDFTVSLSSDQPRESAPAVEAGDLEAQVSGNNAFALDLYQALHSEEGNLLFSPYSISVALAMTYAGARGETEAQMAEALQYVLAQDRLHPVFNAVDLSLSSAGESSSKEEGEEGVFKLHIANSLWGQRDYTFQPEFIDTLGVNYGAGLNLVDFMEAAEQARQAINDWVAEQTEGKIQDLIPQGGISNMTRMVLANAIYFNAAWQEQFDPDMTRDEAFDLLDGSEATVPMMHQMEGFPYTQGEEYQAVELPYIGDRMSMLILLPDEGQFEAFESSLTVENLSGIVDALTMTEMELALPKFTTESTISLPETLSGMGMVNAFVPDQADFSGMDGTRNLFIGDIFHKAYIDVNEEGTEAAAATAVVAELTSAPMAEVEMRVDRPFIYLIRDRETGSIMFLGRVVNPQ